MTKKIIGLGLLITLTTHWTSGQEFIREDILKIAEVSTDKNYGRTEKKSIKVGKIENQKFYLNGLLGPNGEPVSYRRVGSCCEFRSKSAAFGKGFLDVYEVSYSGLLEPIKLYLNGYDYETPLCPNGLTFKKGDSVPEIKVEQPTITDSIFCDKENIYSVDDNLLKAKVGQFKKPDINPKYSGGIEKLKAFFADNKLTDKRTNGIVFRVSIGFVVNCKGETGNLQIVTDGKGDLRELAQQVLEKVKMIPDKWIPATANSQNVDSYQVLSFTVVNGTLDKVSYRE
jgi:hypothetical protein